MSDSVVSVLRVRNLIIFNWLRNYWVSRNFGGWWKFLFSFSLASPQIFSHSFVGGTRCALLFSISIYVYMTPIVSLDDIASFQSNLISFGLVIVLLESTVTPDFSLFTEAMHSFFLVHPLLWLVLSAPFEVSDLLEGTAPSFIHFSGRRNNRAGMIRSRGTRKLPTLIMSYLNTLRVFQVWISRVIDGLSNSLPSSLGPPGVPSSLRKKVLVFQEPPLLGGGFPFSF